MFHIFYDEKKKIKTIESNKSERKKIKKNKNISICKFTSNLWIWNLTPVPLRISYTHYVIWGQISRDFLCGKLNFRKIWDGPIHIDHENAVSFHQRFDLCNSKHENGGYFSRSHSSICFEYDNFYVFFYDDIMKS